MGMDLTTPLDDADFDAAPRGATQSVYRGIMQDLEGHRIVPGQRLVETELASRFGVGRNAVSFWQQEAWWTPAATDRPPSAI
jgi:hypothetical protein